MCSAPGSHGCNAWPEHVPVAAVNTSTYITAKVVAFSLVAAVNMATLGPPRYLCFAQVKFLALTSAVQTCLSLLEFAGVHHSSLQ